VRSSGANDRPASSVGATGILLVAFFICLYALSYNGVLRVDDEHILAARAQSLALWGRLEEPQVYGNLRVRELAAFGDQATQIEPLQTILGAGLYRLGRTLGLGGAQSLFALSLYATGIAVGCVYAGVVVLGHRRRIAVWSAVLFGAGTMAWPYAAVTYRDTLAMCAASLAFLGWSILAAGGRRRWPGAALLTVGTVGGILTKNTIVAILPALALPTAAMAVTAARRRTDGSSRILGVVAGLTLAAILGSLLIPPEGLLARFSAAYYLSLARHFLTAWGSGLLPAIAGPFVSPAKSIFLFSPPLVIALAGNLMGWRTSWKIGLPAVAFTALLAVGQALFYRERWAGSYGWGLRMMLPCLPVLMIAGAPAVEALESGSRRWIRAVLPALLGVSAVIQLAGSWVDLRSVYAAWREAGLDPYGLSAAWEPRFLAIPPQLARLADPASWSVAWMRLLRSGAAEALVGPLAALAIGGVALAFLRRTARARDRLTLPSAVVAALALALPMVPTLGAYQRDPVFGGDRPELAEAAAFLKDNTGAADLIVVDAYATPLWAYLMNRWDAPQPWYALPYEIPGSEGVRGDGSCSLPAMTVELLFDDVRPGSRLFYVTSPDAPDYALGREICRLDAAYDLEASATFGDARPVEVRVYRVP
jgi:hypothetical protein